MISIYVLIGAALLVVGALAMLKFLKNVQPITSSEIADDLNELKQKISQFKNGLETWSDDISSNDLDQIMDSGQTRTGSGVFLSNNNQPIFAYAFRKYIGPAKNSLMYVLTSNHEYVFRTTTKGTEITMDGEKQGIIRENGTMSDVRNRDIANIKRFGATAENKIFINGKEVAKIALPDAVAGIKAIQIPIELNNVDNQIVQTFAVYELVANIGDLR
jgi:hypothetical protein